jgi:hypothetical protein|tara:strand:+ start:842 stop:1615 length:774 start_codon:yes stop_codon:yes gene_type:complete
MSITTEEIKEIAVRVSLGMSKNQILDYVIKSHVTADRQLKQVFLEIENRSHQYEKMLLDEKKGIVRLRKCKEELEKLKAEGAEQYDIDLAEIEVEDAMLDMEMWHRRKGQAQYELNVFIEYVKEKGYTKEQLEEAVEWNAEREREYWIARLGKQAALDIMANGRVGIGNMDSIAMMKQEDQVGILDVASQYACLMKISMDKIQGRTEKYFQAYAESPDVQVPTFHGVEDNLNIPLLDKIRDELNAAKTLQSSDQSEE